MVGLQNLAANKSLLYSGAVAKFRAQIYKMYHIIWEEPSAMHEKRRERGVKKKKVLFTMGRGGWFVTLWGLSSVTF